MHCQGYGYTHSERTKGILRASERTAYITAHLSPPPPPPPACPAWLPRVSPARRAVIETRAACRGRGQPDRSRRGGRVNEGKEADSPPQTSPVHLGCAWRSILREQQSCELGTATERAAAGLTKIPRRSYPLRDRKTLLVLPSVLPRPERRGRAENVESGAHLLVLDRLQSRARQLVPHDRIGPQVALERDEGELDAWTVVANFVDPLIAC